MTHVAIFIVLVIQVEVEVPVEFQGTAIGLLNKRKGALNSQDTGTQTVVINADVPLSSMFGFSTDLRSSTQGKGEFSMEYKSHEFVPGDVQKQLIEKFQKENEAKKK